MTQQEQELRAALNDAVSTMLDQSDLSYGYEPLEACLVRIWEKFPELKPVGYKTWEEEFFERMARHDAVEQDSPKPGRSI